MQSASDPRTVSLPDHRHPDFVGEEAVAGLRIRGTDRCFPLDAAVVSFNIGSARGSDIRLEDQYVSAIHCVLVRDPKGGLLVADRSKNGSFINAVRCKQGHLRVGAHLQVGETVLIAYSEATRFIPTPFERLAGPSGAITELRRMVLSIGATDAHVLVVGEPGAGKRTIAAAIHQASPRAAGPYVVVDCDALGGDEVVVELFGSEGGHPGALTEAHGGTLVVHGVEHLPHGLFPRFMRALSAPDGTERDIRVIFSCADPDRVAVDDHRRLQGGCVELTVPPLRHRPGDMPALVHLFLRELSPPGPPKGVPSPEIAALAGYEWPGNVQELRAALRRAIALAGDSDELTFDLFWPDRQVMMDMLKAAALRAFRDQPTMRKAAESLGMPKSSYARLIKRFLDEDKK